MTATVPRGTTELEAPAFFDAELGHVASIPVDAIDVGSNVRVSVEDLDELAASIKAHGVLQPIKVRAAGERWTVVWGQRRLLAARKAGLERIPALIDVAPDEPTERAIEQLVENLHRADLNPIDRARAMRAVVDAGRSQADLARELGVAPSTIANDLGLLAAPERIQSLVEDGTLSTSHAKALKGLAPSTQVELADKAVKWGYSAHQLEGEVQSWRSQAKWRKEREAQEIESAKAAKEALERGLAALAKKKVPTDVLIVVAGYDYQGARKKEVAELIRQLGYTNVHATGFVASRREALGCDCTAWKVELEYAHVTVVPGCVDPEHTKAKTAAADAVRTARYQLETRVQARISAAGPSFAWPSPIADRSIVLDRTAARMALWLALDYRLGDWSAEQGGKRGDPWSTIAGLSDTALAEELGKAIAKSTRDRFGYHLDWPALAQEFGVQAATEEPTA